MNYKKVDFKFGQDVGWSEIYGAYSIMSEYTGVKQDLLKMYWQHGLITEFESNLDYRAIFGFSTIENNLPILVRTREEVNILKNYGYHNSHAVGLPIVYLDEGYEIQRRKVDNSLLIMPGHLFIGDKFQSNREFKKFLIEISRIKSGYDKVTVLLHENSFFSGHYISEFVKIGVKDFKVAVGNGNANSLYNLREIMQSYEDMITNIWGSHVSYGLYFGLNVELFVAFDTPAEDIFEKDIGLGNPDYHEKINSREFYEELKSKYEFIFESLEKKSANPELGKIMVGYQCKKDIHYLRKILCSNA